METIFLLYETDARVMRKSFNLIGVSKEKTLLIEQLQKKLEESDEETNLDANEVDNLFNINQTQSGRRKAPDCCKATTRRHSPPRREYNYFIEEVETDTVELGGLSG